MRVKVLIFGQLTDIIGLSELHLNDVSDRDELVRALNEQFPELADSKYAMALDKKVISQNTQFADNSVIALLPPFSGG